jgi:hypothetical protein
MEWRIQAFGGTLRFGDSKRQTYSKSFPARLRVLALPEFQISLAGAQLAPMRGEIAVGHRVE